MSIVTTFYALVLCAEAIIMSFSTTELQSALQSTLEVTNDEKHKVDDTHSGKQLVFVCSKPEDFEVDDDNRVYSLKLNDESAGLVRFKVSKCSTVFFAAVHVSKYNLLHSGLVIENDFEVTMNGSTTPYKGGHLLAHAMFVKSESGLDLGTKLLVCMCSTRDSAFNEMATLIKNADYYTRAMSPGFVSSTPCCQLVELLRKEINKPFDKHWATRLSESMKDLPDAPKLGGNDTNCAIFAGRIFYTLAPSEDKDEIAIAGMLKVFKELGFEESKVKPYVSAITK